MEWGRTHDAEPASGQGAGDHNDGVQGGGRLRVRERVPADTTLPVSGFMRELASRGEGHARTLNEVMLSAQ